MNVKAFLDTPVGSEHVRSVVTRLFRVELIALFVSCISLHSISSFAHFHMQSLHMLNLTSPQLRFAVVLALK